MSIHSGLLVLGLAATWALPWAARAAPRLLDLELSPPAIEMALGPEAGALPAPPTARPGPDEPAGDPEHAGDLDPAAEPEPAVLLAVADSQPDGGAKPESGAPPDGSSKPAGSGQKQKEKAPPKGSAPGSLDFDLLGAAAKPPPSVDAGQLRLRRTMLTIHQGLGFTLLGLQLATTVVGQLNYSDRFAGGSTARYQTPHAVLAYTDLGVFAATGLVALLAPKPSIQEHEGFDRITLHKIAMFTAAAGMATQGVLGIYTHQREGYLNQHGIATAHLVVGYVTLAAVAVGVGAIAF